MVAIMKTLPRRRYRLKSAQPRRIRKPKIKNYIIIFLIVSFVLLAIPFLILALLPLSLAFILLAIAVGLKVFLSEVESSA